MITSKPPTVTEACEIAKQVIAAKAASANLWREHIFPALDNTTALERFIIINSIREMLFATETDLFIQYRNEKLKNEIVEMK